MVKERTGERQRGKNYCFVGFMSFVGLHFPPQMQSKVYELRMIIFSLPGTLENRWTAAVLFRENPTLLTKDNMIKGGNKKA